MSQLPSTFERLPGCLFNAALLGLPLLALTVAAQFVDPRGSGFFVIVVIAMLWFTCTFVVGMWRYSFFAQFSLKNMLLATLSLNACLALLFATDQTGWRVFGAALLALWAFIVVVGLLHAGVVARFQRAEKRAFLEMKNDDETKSTDTE